MKPNILDKIEHFLFVWLTRRFCKHIDQHDAFKVTLGKVRYYVEFSMVPIAKPEWYRELK